MRFSSEIATERSAVISNRTDVGEDSPEVGIIGILRIYFALLGVAGSDKTCCDMSKGLVVLVIVLDTEIMWLLLSLLLMLFLDILSKIKLEQTGEKKVQE